MTQQIDPVLIQQGYVGGVRAGLKLLNEIQRVLPLPYQSGTAGSLKLIYIYTSLKGLLQSSGGVDVNSSELGSRFVQGINSISGTLNLVDIGYNKDTLSGKVKGIYRLHLLADS